MNKEISPISAKIAIELKHKLWYDMFAVKQAAARGFLAKRPLREDDMKKRIALFFLLGAVCLFLGSCGDSLLNSETENASRKTLPDTVAVPAQIEDRLTAEKIDSFKIATSDMDAEELRTLCVDFFYFSQTFVWTPSETLAVGEKHYAQGGRYGGFPYLSDACGNVYRLLEFVDPETGVLTISPAMKANPSLFFNQCAWGAFWGWGRVINSADYYWTATMTQKNGFIPVGPYTYDPTLDSFRDGRGTGAILNENGQETMFQSYAALHKADGVVTYINGDASSAGHVMMIAEEPTVVQSAGVIDAEKSFVKVHHQFSTPLTRQDSQGETYHCEGRVNEVISFAKLFRDGYIPFTFAEFLGTDPVEPSEVSVSLPDGAVSVEALMGAQMSANYLVSDVRFDAETSAGDKVSFVWRPDFTQIRKKTFSLADAIAPFNRKKLEDLVKKGEARITISARLSTGELKDVLHADLINE